MNTVKTWKTNSVPRHTTILTHIEIGSMGLLLMSQSKWAGPILTHASKIITSILHASKLITKYVVDMPDNIYCYQVTMYFRLQPYILFMDACRYYTNCFRRRVYRTVGQCIYMYNWQSPSSLFSIILVQLIVHFSTVHQKLTPPSPIFTSEEDSWV